MKARTLIVAAGIVLAVFVFWPGGGETWRIRNRPPRDGPIVCFGDSLTSGQGAAPEESYPAVLGSLVGRPVIGRGRNGDTAASALERLEEDVIALGPAVVIVTLGGNDIMRRVPPEETVRAMRTIFERTLGAGAMVAFLAIDPPFVGTERMEAIRDLCRELGVLYVETAMEGFWGNRKLMSDQIHPNAAGYRLMAERVRDALDDSLGR